VGGVTGYAASPNTGSVVVQGAAVLRSIAFAAAPPTPKSNATSPPEFLGLPLIEGYALLGGIVLLVILALVGAILYRRRPRPPAGGASAAPPPGAGGTIPPP
jgi:hypothetical protein